MTVTESDPLPARTSRTPRQQTLAPAQAETLRNTVEGRLPIQTIALSILGLGAAGAILVVGKALLAPLLLALLLQFLLSPAIRRLQRIGVPPGVSAFAVLAALGALVLGGTFLLWTPAVRWAEDLPHLLRDAERAFRDLKQPVEVVAEAASKVEELTELDSEGLSISMRAPADPLAGPTQLIGGGVLTTFLLFFLLASSDSFLRTMVRVLPRFRDKKLAVEISRQIESQVARYLGTVLVVNAGLGVAIGLWTWAMGLPSPLLWGVVAFAANFVPYVGSALGAGVVGLVAVSTGREPATALVVAGGYMALSGLEGMLVTPAILGRSLTLRPLVVFLWLAVWSFLWGVVGALLAVPLLVVLRILCDAIPSLAAFGAFLSREPSTA